MPVLRAPESSTHELPHARFFSLATPSRGSRETSMWRAELAPQSATPSHTLTREEIFYVLSGSLHVVLDGSASEATAGDVIVVPTHTQVAFRCGDAGAQVLCCLPVGGQAQLDEGPLFTPPWAE